MLYKLEKYADALVWIEKAIQNGGVESGEVREHYGDILFKLGRIDDAVIQWEKAKELGGASAFLEQKLLEQKMYE